MLRNSTINFSVFLVILLLACAGCVKRHSDFEPGVDAASDIAQKDVRGELAPVDLMSEHKVDSALEVADQVQPEDNVELFDVVGDINDIADPGPDLWSDVKVDTEGELLSEILDEVDEDLMEDLAPDVVADVEVDAGCSAAAPDEVGDGIDQNCDGVDGVDFDGDGYASLASGGTDCDDTSEHSYPGAPDFVAGACSDPQATSDSEVVDEEGNTGYYSSAGMGPDGTLYVAYRQSSEPQLVRLARKGPADETWSFFTPYDGPGQYIDLAIAGGELHITFYDKSACKCLRYVHASLDALGAGQWTEAVVDDDDSAEVGRYSSLAIDADGFVHVAYFDQTNLNLKYASNVTGEFVAVVVSGDDVVEGEFEKIGRYSSLALDSEGFAHIATHYETGLSLAYLTNKEGNWQRQIIDSDGADVGRYPSLAVDGNDAVHIAYRNSSLEDLRYATNASGVWQTEDVDGLNLKVGSYGAIAIDKANRVHISYNQGDLDYLRYATNKPGYWVATTVESGYQCGLQTSIVLGADATAHIFSTHNALQKLLHTTASLDCLAQGDEADSNCDGVDGFDGDQDGFPSIDSGGSDCDDDDATVQPQWVTTVLDEGPSVGEFASLAIDGQSVLHASYRAANPKDLLYARLEPGGEWQIEPADDSGHDVGEYSSIAVSAVDPEDELGATVHIAYRDATSNELWYASNATGAWVPEVVEETPDPTQDVGEHASLALDSDDFAHIAYYDAANYQLRYATNETGAWVLRTIPNDGNAGKNTAVTAYKGVVYIAYQAVGAFDLMVASGSGDDWTVELVDGGDLDVGEAVSIAVDKKKRIHVFYRDANVRDLHYALRTGAQWSLWTIDEDADVGKWSSVALDGNNMVHVAYKDQATDALLYATNVVVENYQWTKEPVTGADGVPCGGLSSECGSHVSLSFDPKGRLHTIHYDDFNKRLLYSRKSCLGY